MVTVYIIESSFLIRLAFKKVLQSIDETIDIHEMSSFKDFESINEPTVPYLVLFGRDSISPQETIRVLHEKGCKVILVTSDNYAQSTADEVININDDSDVIFQKLKKFIDHKLISNPANNHPKLLSERETDILKYVAMGLTNKEIADKLFISIHTVITHRKNISAKLGIKTIAGFTVYALINHIVSPENIRQI